MKERYMYKYKLFYFPKKNNLFVLCITLKTNVAFEFSFMHIAHLTSCVNPHFVFYVYSLVQKKCTHRMKIIYIYIYIYINFCHLLQVYVLTCLCLTYIYKWRVHHMYSQEQSIQEIWNLTKCRYLTKTDLTTIKK